MRSSGSATLKGRAIPGWMLLLSALASACDSSPPFSGDAVVEIPLEFPVVIQNRTPMPCLGIASGPTTIRGTLVAPERLPSTVTLYLHGLGFGQWFWHFSAPTIPELDHVVELARRGGHASLIIDRLGYGASPLADGNDSCLGVQADIAAQISEQLQRSPFGFRRVALAGHSAGGAATEIAAFSFPEAFDAFIVMGYADQGESADTVLASVQAEIECLSNPSHYAHFGRTDADFAHLMFNTARPLTGQLPVIDSAPTADEKVIAAVVPLRSQDPCGDLNSLPQALVFSQLLLSSVSKPMLLVCGERDAVYPPPACELQALRMASNPGFQYRQIPGAGHVLTLGSTAPEFRAVVSGWLASQGF